MKAKILRKKMVLNKRTITNLNNPEMKEVYAGYDKTQRTVCTCNTLISCYTDATCCGGACITDFTCPITPEPVCA
jgi:hypothetical protein